jgi:hypothetical protein
MASSQSDCFSGSARRRGNNDVTSGFQFIERLEFDTHRAEQRGAQNRTSGTSSHTYAIVIVAF